MEKPDSDEGKLVGGEEGTGDKDPAKKKLKWRSKVSGGA